MSPSPTRRATSSRTTQTINALFGARFAMPGTGLIANNYMHNFDPRPGRALSVAPGKRVYTSMAPTIVLKDGRPRFALGLPGGLRIFPSAFQALLNLIDHGMTLQAAVEAPRIWTHGQRAGAGARHSRRTSRAGARRARPRGQARASTIGGGINGIAFDARRQHDRRGLLAGRRLRRRARRRAGAAGRALHPRHQQPDQKTA